MPIYLKSDFYKKDGSPQGRRRYGRVRSPKFVKDNTGREGWSVLQSGRRVWWDDVVESYLKVLPVQLEETNEKT